MYTENSSRPLLFLNIILIYIYDSHSSANAKKWEVELQTLKNNNVRLTTALQESTANVEEWKKQLSAYKEESARMKKKVKEFFVEKQKGERVKNNTLSMKREITRK